MKPVTDPTLLSQLDAPDSGKNPVTDPSVVSQLESNPAERGIVDQIGRALGRTVRAGVQGVTALPGLVADIPRNLVATAQQAGEVLGGAPVSTFLRGRDSAVPSTAGAVSGLLTKAGLPTAENATERVAEDVVGAMAGAGGMVKAGQAMTKAASPLAQRIGEILATNAGGQVISSGAGTGAAGVTREEGGGAGAQLAAGIAGTLAPAAASTTLAEATRRFVRGGEAGRQRVAANIRDFQDAGAGMPTVGQAAETRGMRAVESGLAKTPGSAGRMIAKGEAEAQGLAEKVDAMASTLSSRTGATPAGMEIRGGLGKFATNFKAKAGSLYDELDNHIAPDSPVQVGNTTQVLDELTALKPGAQAISGAMVNPKIAGWKAALAKDVQGGNLPYSAIKDLRSRVGELLSDSGLVADAPRAQLKKVYSALTADMTEAARVAGPQAEQALGRANSFYAAGMKRIDDVLDPILKKTDPEDIYKAAVAGTNEGATTLRGVMKSLPEESRKVVAATTLKRLGKAVASKQDEMGEVFSPETFLTNWNKITPEAKTTLFASLPGDMRKDLDKIAKVASNLRDGSKVFSNPSGTAQAATNQLTAGAAILSMMTGNVGAAGAIAGGVLGANAASRVMTNPLAVKWLAEATRVPVEQLPAQLNTLSQTIFRMDKDEREDAREFVRQARSALSSAEAKGQGQ